jgi:hypothetical protein
MSNDKRKKSLLNYAFVKHFAVQVCKKFDEFLGAKENQKDCIPARCESF